MEVSSGVVGIYECHLGLMQSIGGQSKRDLRHGTIIFMKCPEKVMIRRVHNTPLHLRGYSLLEPDSTLIDNALNQ